MPISTLATVELQLIMQFCNATSLLHLARCSRTLLVAASHPFPWAQLRGQLRLYIPQHPQTSIFWIGDVWLDVRRWFNSQLNRPDPTPFTGGMVARFAEPTLEWPGILFRLFGLELWQLRDGLRTLATFAPVRSLDLEKCTEYEAVQTLLRLPCFAQLTALRLSKELSMRAPRALLDAPVPLRQLELCSLPNADVVALLNQLSELTHLAIHCKFAADGMRGLANCAHLQRLTLLEPHAGSLLVLLSTTASAATLRHLALNGLRVASAVHCALWPVAIQHLRVLESVTLVECAQLPSILLALSMDCPTLRLLQVKPATDQSFARAGNDSSSWPSAKQVLKLLEETRRRSAVAAPSADEFELLLFFPPLERMVRVFREVRVVDGQIRPMLELVYAGFEVMAQHDPRLRVCIGEAPHDTSLLQLVGHGGEAHFY